MGQPHVTENHPIPPRSQETITSSDLRPRQVTNSSLRSWMKRDQLDVTCFIISLFNAQHVSDVNTSILRTLRLICWVNSWVVLLWFIVCWCYVVVWLWWCGIRMQASACIRLPHQSNTTHEITQQISRKFLRMDVLTSETCWALNNEIIKQVTSSWSLFIQLSRWCTVQ